MSRSPRNASARRLRRVAARMAWHRVDWRQRLGGTGSRANGRRRGATRRYVATRSMGGHADCVGRSRSALGIDRRRREVASRIGERPLGTATSKNPSHDGIGPDSRAFASHGHGPDTVRPPICFFTHGGSDRKSIPYAEMGGHEHASARSEERASGVIFSEKRRLEGDGPPQAARAEAPDGRQR